MKGIVFLVLQVLLLVAGFEGEEGFEFNPRVTIISPEEGEERVAEKITQFVFDAEGIDPNDAFATFVVRLHQNEDDEQGIELLKQRILAPSVDTVMTVQRLTPGDLSVHVSLHRLKDRKEIASHAVRFRVLPNPHSEDPALRGEGGRKEEEKGKEEQQQQPKQSLEIWPTPSKADLEEWPLRNCEELEPLPGFPPISSFKQRPFIVFQYSWDLDWMVFDERPIAKCSPPCLWVRKMSCPHLADVVLFGCGIRAQPPAHLTPLTHQIRGYWCLESENGVNYAQSFLDSLDFNVTHRQTVSTLPVTYIPGNRNLLMGVDRRILRNKSGFVMVTNSNCGQERDLYVMELMQYLDVDSYGKCMNNMEWPESDPNSPHSPYVQLLSKYQFVLSFENAFSVDYVSERFWHPLIAGCVPVYWGAPNIVDIAPSKDSFVNVRDFASPKDLAEHLIYLRDHPAEYAKLHAWRDQPLPPRFLELQSRSMTTHESIYGEGTQHGRPHRLNVTRIHNYLVDLSEKKRNKSARR